MKYKKTITNLIKKKIGELIGIYMYFKVKKEIDQENGLR